MQPITTQFYTETGHLIPTPPFDFAKSLNFLGSFAPMQGEQTLATSTLTKAVYIEGQIIAFQLTSVGTVEEPMLEYILFSDQPIRNSVKSRAVDSISFFLSLNDDLCPFYRIGREDSDFAPIVQELYGYHQVKFLTPFEVACWAVLVQRNPLNIAQKMKQALIESYGGGITLQGTTYWAFPEATRLVHANESELLAAVRNARKAEYLVAVIRAFSEVDEHFLRTADYDEVATWLHSIRGFGEWSVSFVLLRGLGRMEKVPVSEKKIMAAASRLYGHGRDLTRTEVEKIVERYGPYKGYWAHYMRVGS
jgi:DNA-3-methyladenine glycosylase II